MNAELARLEDLERNGSVWVCAGPEMHGHAQPSFQEGRPACFCGAGAFVRLDEALRRIRSGLPLLTTAA